MKRMFILLLLIVVVAGAFYFSYRRNPRTDMSPPNYGNITISGTVVCLPHKNTRGPLTMECAIGLKDQQGKYYALRDRDNRFNLYEAGRNITVQGVSQAPDPNNKYDIQSVIDVESVIQNKTPVTTFDECVAAGNIIREKYPEECVTPDGQVFTNPAQMPD